LGDNGVEYEGGTKIKLAITTQACEPETSGTANAIKEICRVLIRDYNYDITILIPNYWNDPVITNKKNLKIKRFPFFEIARRYSISFPLLKSLMKSDYDLIHSFNIGYFPATSGFIASRLKKKPHIFTTVFHPTVYSFYRTALFWAYNLTQGLFTLRGSKKVLPITKFEKKQLIKIGAKKENMEVIPLPIDTERFKPSKQKPKIKIKGKVVLKVGSLTKDKGAYNIFNICKSILKERKDTTFVFIGKGELEYELKLRARKYGNKIIFIKNISLEELIKWYSRADIVVLASYYEAFSMILTEARACGTPVVSTAVGGIPDVMKKGGFLVKYGDWKGFKSKIIQLLDNGWLRFKMGKEGREYVVKNFDSKVVVKKLVSIYEDAIRREK